MIPFPRGNVITLFMTFYFYSTMKYFCTISADIPVRCSQIIYCILFQY